MGARAKQETSLVRRRVSSEGWRRSPYASLRWHYPDQVQRVFLTHNAGRFDREHCRTPALARAHNTPASRRIQPEPAAARRARAASRTRAPDALRDACACRRPRSAASRRAACAENFGIAIVSTSVAALRRPTRAPTPKMSRRNVSPDPFSGVRRCFRILDAIMPSVRSRRGCARFFVPLPPPAGFHSSPFALSCRSARPLSLSRPA